MGVLRRYAGGMTWRIPAWYRGPLSRTPYASLDRWRLWPRILAYCLYAPLGVGLVLCAVSPERMAQWLLWLREISGQSRYTAGLLVIGAFSVLLYGPAISCLVLARGLRNRQLNRLRGRCLNCSDSRLSEFLDDCSKCGSQFKEQDQYRAVVTTRLLRRRPRGVRQPVTELRQSRRTAIIVSLIAVGLMVICGFWMACVEEGMRPPIPMSLARVSFILSIFGIVPPGIMLARWDFKRLTHHLLRLKGRCMECETPLDEFRSDCSQCGSSIIAQQLWICRILIQFQGSNRQQVLDVARELEVPTSVGLSKP